MQPVNKFSSTKNLKTPQNPLGAGAPRKPHQKTIDRIHIAVRLEMRNLGMPDSQIARIIGISQSAYSILKKTKIYQDIKVQYTSGILSKLDDGVEDTYGNARKYLEVGVPIAMANLLRMAMDETNKRLQFKASQEILDRHGLHAKVSRIGVATPEQNAAATNEDNEMAQALLAAKAPKIDNGVIVTQNVDISSPPLTESKQ